VYRPAPVGVEYVGVEPLCLLRAGRSARKRGQGVRSQRRCCLPSSGISRLLAARRDDPRRRQGCRTPGRQQI